MRVVRVRLAIVGLALAGCASAPPAETGSKAEVGAGYSGPIIDMHIHAFEWDRYGPDPPPNPVSGVSPAARTDQAAALASLAELDRFRVVKAVASGPPSVVERWHELDPDRIVPGVYVERPEDLPPPDEVRALVESGRLAVLGEIGAQYAGGTLADEGWTPYLDLAEELGLPVAIHTGVGPPRTPYEPCCPGFRSHLGRPAHLEEVLVRHPDLKIYLMHAGLPWLEETLALLHLYPRIYVEVAVIDWIVPRAQFHAYLKALVDAGFEDRILFGSDQMIWPDAIALSVAGVDSAPFLTPAQKRKIFHDNAVRFLGLAPTAPSP
jgi:hypothetical protein